MYVPWYRWSLATPTQCKEPPALSFNCIDDMAKYLEVSNILYLVHNYVYFMYNPFTGNATM